MHWVFDNVELCGRTLVHDHDVMPHIMEVRRKHHGVNKRQVLAVNGSTVDAIEN